MLRDRKTICKKKTELQALPCPSEAIANQEPQNGGRCSQVPAESRKEMRKHLKGPTVGLWRRQISTAASRAARLQSDCFCLMALGPAEAWERLPQLCWEELRRRRRRRRQQPSPPYRQACCGGEQGSTSAACTHAEWGVAAELGAATRACWAPGVGWGSFCPSVCLSTTPISPCWVFLPHRSSASCSAAHLIQCKCDGLRVH